MNVDNITKMYYETAINSYSTRLATIEATNDESYNAEIITLKMAITLLTNLISE
jgi:hypothetical protein